MKKPLKIRIIGLGVGEAHLKSYKKISNQSLHSEKISNHVAILAKNKKIREIVNQIQKSIIKNNNRICVEGRDIASKILSKNPKYDLAFYFKCSLDVASYRRWLDIKKMNLLMKKYLYHLV